MDDKEPSPRRCLHCDFGTGHRGMDWCHVCGGTGSVFRIDGMTFQNTKEGYEKAKALLNKERNV